MNLQYQTTITNLRRLTALRAIAVTGFVAAGVLMSHGLTSGALALVLLGFCTTLVSGWRSRSKRPLHQWEFFGHLLMDWLWLPPLLAISGGAANPFVTYLLVPLTIAAATLPRFYSWMMAVLSIGIYTALIAIFPDNQSAHAGHNMSGSGDFYRHLLGMWATFTFSALLIAAFVNSMAAALRERDRNLHQLRQEQSRREQILSLGTLAAGTAHELATPLQTVSLLVEELQSRESNGPETEADLALLQQQVNLCKQALEQLKSRARDPENRTQVQKVGVFVDRCLERWQLLRADARFVLRTRGPKNSSASLPLTLEQALINLLNNAADACSKPVEVEAVWSAQLLQIKVIDSGRGLYARGVDEAPKGDQQGFGIGLLLSEAALGQLGGTLELVSRAPENGTIATIRLPLTETVDTESTREQESTLAQPEALV